MVDSPECEYIQDTSYCCHTDVVWSVESDSLNIIRRDTGTRLSLKYPEAALWDLLTRRVPIHRVIEMIAAIAGMEPEAARVWCIDTIGVWTREGWLTKG